VPDSAPVVGVETDKTGTLLVKQDSRESAASGAKGLTNAPRLLLAATRPKHVLQAFFAAVQLIGLCSLAALGGVLFFPVEGARKRKLVGFILGSIGGLIWFLAFLCTAVILSSVQLLRGIYNTPACLLAIQQRKLWIEGRWVDCRLDVLELEMENKMGKEESSGDSLRQEDVEVAETKLYDLLECQPSASPVELKRAYYKQAKKCHPDTHPGDEELAARFRKLAEAYQVLSDPDLRSKYDEGGEAGLEGSQLSKIDPSAFFGLLFGCEEFAPWIGELELAMQAKEATTAARQQNRKRRPDVRMQLQDFQYRSTVKTRQYQRQRLRVVRCACNLRERLAGWVNKPPSGQESWEASMRQVAADLAKGEGGPDLLIVLGESYQTQARRYLSTERFGPLSPAGLIFSTQLVWLRVKRQTTFAGKAVWNIVKLMSRLRADAKKLKSRRKTGQEQQRQFAEAAMRKALPSVLETGWGIVIKDVERTTRSVGQHLLCDKSVDPATCLQRAKALQRLGTIFLLEGTRTHAARMKVSTSTDAASSYAYEAKLQAALQGSMRGSPRNAARAQESYAPRAKRAD